jgi:hypothetical protein
MQKVVGSSPISRFKASSNSWVYRRASGFAGTRNVISSAEQIWLSTVMTKSPRAHPIG